MECVVETLVTDRVAHSLARLSCGVAADFVIHSWVVKFFESGLKSVCIGRWFLTLLSLRPELGPCRDAEAHRFSGALTPLELARGLVDIVTVWLLVMDKSGSAREAIQLLGGRVIGGVVTNLLAICDTGQHFSSLLFYFLEKY